MTDGDGDAPRIVVGVDGSADGDLALRWAVGEAKLRRARVQAVHAWQYPVAGEVGFAYPPEVMEAVRQGAADILAQAVGSLDEEVEIERRLVMGSAAHALLDAAHGADLLVVGSRGRGGFTGLLLGSVSQQCAQHAPCPVVIMPSASGSRES